MGRVGGMNPARQDRPADLEAVDLGFRGAGKDPLGPTEDGIRTDQPREAHPRRGFHHTEQGLHPVNVQSATLR